LLSNSLLSTTVMLALVSILMAGVAPLFFPLIASHYSAEKLSLAIKLFYGLEPIIVLTGMASICVSVLNTTGAFAVPALTPIATPLVFLLFIPMLAGPFGAWAMVFATLAGALLQAIWAGWMMKARGYRLDFRWHGMDDATREVAGQFWPVMLSGLVASGGLLVDQSMAAMLPGGSVSALAYAGRFVSVALALLGGAVSSAVTPAFSEMVALGDWRECRRSMRMWALGSAVVATLAAGALMLGARFLVRLAFQHGAFGVQDTSAVSYVLIMYAIQIPFFVSSRVFYRFLVAMRRTEIVFYCGLLNLVLDVVLNMVLMHWFGVAGIALATSLWMVSTLAFLGYWSWRILPADREFVASRAG
jgi:putative peptidoglycan lipid II flippase